MNVWQYLLNQKGVSIEELKVELKKRDGPVSGTYEDLMHRIIFYDICNDTNNLWNSEGMMWGNRRMFPELSAIADANGSRWLKPEYYTEFMTFINNNRYTHKLALNWNQFPTVLMP